MDKLKHVYVNLLGIENLEYKDVKNLHKLVSADLEENSALIGTVHCTAVPDRIKNPLETKFPLFTILTDDEVIIDSQRTDSTEMALNDTALMASINGRNWSSLSEFMIKGDAEKITSWPDAFGGGLEIITDFTAFKYFNNITSLPGEGNTSSTTTRSFNCPKLKVIEIPESVKSIGYSTFCSTAIEEIDLKNVTEIRDSTGYYYSNTFPVNLKRIKMPKVTKIGRAGYAAATNLRGVFAPSNTNSNLEEIVGGLAEGVSIGCMAFRGCSKLVLAELPLGVTLPTTSSYSGNTVGYQFYNCSLVSFTSLPSSITTIGVGTFTNTACNFEELPETVETIYGFPWANTTGTLTYPLYNSNYVSWGGYKTFDGALTNSIINNDNIQTDGSGNIILKKNLIVGESAFNGNTNLVTISGCKTINTEAFKGCTLLTNVSGAEGAIGTATGVFYGCTGLTEVTDDIWNLFGTTMPTTTFYGCSGITELNFPDKLTDKLNANSILGTSIRRLNTNNFTSLDGNDNIMYERWIRFLECPKVTTTAAWSRSFLPKVCEFAYFPELVSTGNTSRLTSSPMNKVFIGDKIQSFGAYTFDYGSFDFVVITRKDTAPSFTGTTMAGSGKIYVPTGMKESYLTYSGWNKFANRIIELSDEEIEALKDETPYYGVLFNGSKYYDTKRTISTGDKFMGELGYLGTSSYLFGVGNTSRNNNQNSISVGNTFTHYAGGAWGGKGVACSSYVKHSFEVSSSITKLDNTTTDGIWVTPDSSYNAYLGGTNVWGSSVSKYNGLLYKFFWYSGDYLVLAWYGNADGGFDIYANEDIEPQTNDIKYSLLDLATRDEELTRKGGILPPTTMSIETNMKGFHYDSKIELYIDCDGVGDCDWTVIGNATLENTTGSTVVATSTGAEGDTVTFTAVSRIDGTTLTTRTFTLIGALNYGKSITLDGNSVFDLGYVPKANSKVVVTYKPTAVTSTTQAIIGSRQSAGSADSFCAYLNTTKLYYMMGSGGTDSGITVTANSQNTLTITPTSILNNSTTVTPTGTFTPGSFGLSLGSINTLGHSEADQNGGFTFFTGVIEGVKIYEDNVLVQDWRAGITNNTMVEILSDTTITNSLAGTATVTLLFT